MSDTKEKFNHRTTGPIITSGFRMGVNAEIAVVDFLDAPAENVTNVISSIAFTKKQAKSLVNNLNKFINLPEESDSE